MGERVGRRGPQDMSQRGIVDVLVPTNVIVVVHGSSLELHHIACLEQAVFAFITECPERTTITRRSSAVLMDAMRQLLAE